MPPSLMMAAMTAAHFCPLLAIWPLTGLHVKSSLLRDAPLSPETGDNAAASLFAASTASARGSAFQGF